MCVFTYYNINYTLILNPLQPSMNFGIIQKLSRCIIRPPRSTYSLSQLGNPQIQYHNRTYQHQHFKVINNRGLQLQCTIIKDKYSPIARQIIIFLHANGSNRLIIKNYMDIFLPYYDLVSFDFAGCGLSQGQFITLGYNQREDVYSVIRMVRERYGVKDVILWGRSMGAATAILYAAKYRGIKAVISDNSFSDLTELVRQLADEYIPFLPNFLIDSVIDSIQDYIQQTIWKQQITNFQIKKLKPIKVIQHLKCPIFFIGSQNDTFVNIRHTKLLFEKVKTFKILQLVKGDHNDIRSDILKQKVLHFLINLNLNNRPRSRSRISIFKSIQKPQKNNINKNNNLNSLIQLPQKSIKIKYQYYNTTTLSNKKFILKLTQNSNNNNMIIGYQNQNQNKEIVLQQNFKLQKTNGHRKRIFNSINNNNYRMNKMNNNNIDLNKQKQK